MIALAREYGRYRYRRIAALLRDAGWSVSDGRAFRTLNILDEFSRECLAIKVDRRLNSGNVIDALTDLFILRGPLAFIRSDNGLCAK